MNESEQKELINRIVDYFEQKGMEVKVNPTPREKRLYCLKCGRYETEDYWLNDAQRFQFNPYAIDEFELCDDGDHVVCTRCGDFLHLDYDLEIVPI